MTFTLLQMAAIFMVFLNIAGALINRQVHSALGWGLALLYYITIISEVTCK